MNPKSSPVDPIGHSYSIIVLIKNTLVSGEDVLISGFGKFRVKQKAERKGRNPATGENKMISARKI